MNQVSNNETNVDDLMQKIRKEVADRNHPLLPTALSSVSKSSEVVLVSNFIEDLLTNAESRSHIRTKWPDKLNRFPFSLTVGLQKILLRSINFLFKDQREINLMLIQALKESMKLNQRLTDQVSDLNGQVSDLNGQVSDLNGQVSDLNGQVSDLNGQVSDLNGQVSDLNGQVSDLNGQFIVVSSRIQSIDTRTLTNDVYIKNDLNQQKRLTTMFLDDARKRLSETFTKDELENFFNEEKHVLDAFYVAFEDEFRGSREDIYERLKVYIPILEAANVDREAQILDVGCGRGEWLELLNSFGYKAKGIDLNRVMLEQCQVKGLEVTESDVVQYLQSLPDGSLGVVTGFHIIEHLSFNELMKLLSETWRVLKQGGMAIFETPNPHNLLVGCNNFYIDPTHRNPLPSELTRFLLEYIGFSSVEIVNLHPFNDEVKLKGTEEVIQRFNDCFYGSQDYAVVGIKQ